MKLLHSILLSLLFSSLCLSQNIRSATAHADLNQTLQTLWEESKSYINKGEVANYIPELSKADKNKIGVALMDAQGNIHAAGDTKTRFTMQSISKVIALFIAVQERGETYVFERVGYFGTNAPFNSFAELDTHGAPLNPMMNAGAIVTTSLIEGEKDEAFQKILRLIRYITLNDSIDYNRAVYFSEKETGHRNRGMFHLLKNAGLIEAENEESLNNYFRQCAIEVTAEDLAKIGWFFAHDCIRYDGDSTYHNPSMSQLINAIMLTAGMYDYSGEYARRVGIPSKSGVGGGIMGAAPGKYGIGTFNPALDQHGNSAPGVFLFEELSKKLGLSVF